MVTLFSDEMYAAVRKAAANFRGSWWIEVDDLYQEGCYAILRWARIRGEAPIPEKLLGRIVRNRMRLYIRGFRRMGSRFALVEAHYPKHMAPPVARIDVADAMGRVSETHRKTLEARYFEYRSIAELAESFGVADVAVRRRNQRAYAAMRGVLAGGYGPTDTRVAAIRGWRDRTGEKVDWSSWGPIPNQRKDD